MHQFHWLDTSGDATPEVRGRGRRCAVEPALAATSAHRWTQAVQSSLILCVGGCVGDASADASVLEAGHGTCVGSCVTTGAALSRRVAVWLGPVCLAALIGLEAFVLLPRFLLVLALRWRLLLGIALGTVGLTALVVLTQADQYTASASVLLELRPVDPMSGANLVPLGSGFISTQIDLVGSERVLGLALQRWQETGAAPLHSAEQWQRATGGQGDYKSWQIAQLRDKLDILPTRDSGVLTVSFAAGRRDTAAAMANAIIQAYVQTALELRIEPARADKRFFTERGAQLREALAQAQARLSARQRETGVVGSTEQRLDIENARLLELSSQLSSLQAVTAESGSRESQALGQGERLTEVVTNPMLVALNSQRTQQLARLVELRSRLGDNHPQVREAQAASESLRVQFEQESARVASTLGLNNRVNQARLAQAFQALAAQRERVLRLKDRSGEVAVLEREVQSAQHSYDAALAQGARTGLESLRTQPAVTVIKEASPPARRSSPVPSTALAVAALVGGLLALAVVLLIENLDMRLRTADEVLPALGVPLLVMLPPREF